MIASTVNLKAGPKAVARKSTEGLFLDNKPIFVVSKHKLIKEYEGFNYRLLVGSTENDVVFDKKEWDEVVGYNSAFVTRWYDQSGNGYDVERTTANERPRLYLNGAYEDGVFFDGVNDSLRRAAFFTGGDITAFCVGRHIMSVGGMTWTATNSGSNFNSILQGTTTGNQCRAWIIPTTDATVQSIPAKIIANNDIVINTAQWRISGSNTLVKCWNDGSEGSEGSRVTPVGINSFSLGVLLRPNIFFYSSWINTIVIYDRLLSDSERIDVENILKTYDYQS